MLLFFVLELGHAQSIPDGVAPNYVELDGYFAEPWFVAGIEGSLGCGHDCRSP